MATYFAGSGEDYFAISATGVTGTSWESVPALSMTGNVATATAYLFDTADGVRKGFAGTVWSHARVSIGSAESDRVLCQWYNNSSVPFIRVLAGVGEKVKLQYFTTEWVDIGIFARVPSEFDIDLRIVFAPFGSFVLFINGVIYAEKTFNTLGYENVARMELKASSAAGTTLWSKVLIGSYNTIGHTFRTTDIHAPSLDLNFLTGTLDGRITFTRGSAGTRVNSSGLIESITTNNPRFDYDPVSIGTAKGLLIEEARTNLLLRSQQFTNAYWTGASCTPTDNTVTSPDGTTNASTLTMQNNSYPSVFVGVTAANATAHFVGVFAKAGTRNTCTLELRGATGSVYDYQFTLTGAGTATVNPSAVGSPTGGIVQFSNGWYYCWIVKTTTNTSPIAIIGCQSGILGETFHIWQADMQPGAFPTSPIPTIASQVTRSADVASMTGSNFTSWFNQSEGSFLVQGDSFEFTSVRPYFSVEQDSNNLLYSAVKNRANYMVVGGVAVADLSPNGSVSVNTAYSQAIAYKVNDFAATFAGGAVLTDTSGSLPTPTLMKLGASSNGGTNLNGHLRILRYYQKRLINSHLQALSGSNPPAQTYTEWSSSTLPISSTSAGQRATFTAEFYPESDVTMQVKTVTVGARANKDVSTPLNIKMMLRIESTNYFSAFNVPGMGTTYSGVLWLWDKDPTTDQSWSSVVNINTEFGVQSAS